MTSWLIKARVSTALALATVAIPQFARHFQRRRHRDSDIIVVTIVAGLRLENAIVCLAFWFLTENWLQSFQICDSGA